LFLTFSYGACLVSVPLLCFMVSSLAASAEVRLVFPTGGPAYVCLGCEGAFLRPGPRGERWLTAVKSGIVWDRAARDFERRVKVRKCSCASGEDTNGVSLGYCHPCYKVHQPTTSKRASVCSSLLHPQVSTDRPATIVPGPKCLRLLWETCKAEREARLPWRRRHKVCPSCKWRAEQLAATSVGPATPPPAPPAAAAVPKSAGADGSPTIHDPALVEIRAHRHVSSCRRCQWPELASTRRAVAQKPCWVLTYDVRGRRAFPLSSLTGS